MNMAAMAAKNDQLPNNAFEISLQGIVAVFGRDGLVVPVRKGMGTRRCDRLWIKPLLPS